MSNKVLWEVLSNSDMQEWLDCSKKFLAAVDEIIDLTPVSSSPSNEEIILRHLFMDARTTVYDICVLAESLLNDDRHIYSRGMEAAIRLLYENTIDYFYISESDASVVERRVKFMLITNSQGKKQIQKAFDQKYGKQERGDYWSGKSREEKMDLGLFKCPKYSNNKSFSKTVKDLFKMLNEGVHGNSTVDSYLSFDKDGKHRDEYRRQVTIGLLSIILFYFLSEAYFEFTGRGSEVDRFVFYGSDFLKFTTPEN